MPWCIRITVSSIHSDVRQVFDTKGDISLSNENNSTLVVSRLTMFLILNYASIFQFRKSVVHLCPICDILGFKNITYFEM